MVDKSVLKLGGICAILLGVTKIVSGLAYLLIPAEQRLGVAGAQLLPSFAGNQGMLLTLFWAEALVGVLGLAVVPALSGLVRKANEGWVQWTGTLAGVGFAVSAIGYMLTVARLPNIATAFVNGDSSTKAALAAVWKSSPDLLGFWGYSAIGIWILVVSIAALRGGVLPNLLAYLGFVVAALHIVVPILVVTKAQEVILAIVAISVVALPVWYGWAGWIIYNKGKEQ